MAISKEKKAKTLEKLSTIVKDSLSLVLINFKGVSVKETREIRKALKEKNVGYIVAKNTLTKKALSNSKIEGSMPEMSGETALVYGKDILSPAQEIFNFQKKLDKRILIIGGVFEGRFMNQAEMTSVANIPGVKTLQAQFVNLINSPIQRFVLALDQISKKQNQ